MSDEKIYLHAESEPEMAAAAEAARASFKHFWRELSWEQRRIIPGLDFSAIKFPFSDPDDPDEVEQMWITDIDFDGETISGSLINQPHYLKTYNAEDTVKKPLNELSDWMYSSMGFVCGGYSVNVMRKQMQPSERKQHDQAWGLDFGNPDEIHIVAPETTPKKGLLAKLSGRTKQPPPIDPPTEHPMALNMVANIHDYIKENPQMLNEPDSEGWLYLHRDALAGNAVIVEQLIKAGADPKAKTPTGKDARELAQILGWDNVIDVLAS